MSVDSVLVSLDGNSEILESYVLVREIKVLLELSCVHFHPTIKIKVYKSSVIRNSQYHFDVSHYVQTPLMASPYQSSIPTSTTEEQAINRAISTSTGYLKSAIEAGHEPSNSWLVENKDF